MCVYRSRPTERPRNEHGIASTAWAERGRVRDHTPHRTTPHHTRAQLAWHSNSVRTHAGGIRTTERKRRWLLHASQSAVRLLLQVSTLPPLRRYVVSTVLSYDMIHFGHQTKYRRSLFLFLLHTFTLFHQKRLKQLKQKHTFVVTTHRVAPRPLVL